MIRAVPSTEIGGGVRLESNIGAGVMSRPGGAVAVECTGEPIGAGDGTTVWYDADDLGNAEDGEPIPVSASDTAFAPHDERTLRYISFRRLAYSFQNTLEEDSPR